MIFLIYRAKCLVKGSVSVASDAASKCYVCGVKSSPFGMMLAELGILEQTDNCCLAGLLKGEKRRGLEPIDGFFSVEFVG